ncbi:MAG: lectin OAA [Bacteroidia bacterium]
MALYQVQNQWGGEDAPWHEGGRWALGSRDGEQYVVGLHLTSFDNGYSLEGTVLYSGEEYPIAVVATSVENDHGEMLYDIQTQTENEDWQQAGSWTIGARPGQSVMHLDISSDDDGKSLGGTMTYMNEGPIGFYAEMAYD